MIVYKGLLDNHIADAFPIPDDSENTDHNDPRVREKYPHWTVYVKLFCGSPIDVWSLGTNAKIIGRIPVERLKTMTVNDFINEGVRIII